MRLAVFGGLLSAVLVLLLALPPAALVGSTAPLEVGRAFVDPRFAPAIALSLQTTAVSVALGVGLGTPLAWWLARERSAATRIVGVLLDLPIVVPPAVVGVALLQTFGRRGIVGGWLADLGRLAELEVAIPFTPAAVVLAQLVVASPFYVQAATAAFREVDSDTLLVARTLGASPAGAFLRVALPGALPGLLTGASLCAARALGEFGATLLFAGNQAGRTQTMPLAVYTALQSDLHLAVVFSVALAAVGACVLLAFRAVAARLGHAR